MFGNISYQMGPLHLLGLHTVIAYGLLKNLGTIDRLLRLALGLTVAGMYYTNVIPGTIGLILSGVALVLMLTGIVGFCPLYAVLGIKSNTNPDTSNERGNAIDFKGTILDVRTEVEFAQGHVEGSLNIPLSQIESHVNKISALKQPLQICCRSGNRSGQAVAMIKARNIDCRNVGGWTGVKRQLAEQQT